MPHTTSSDSSPPLSSTPAGSDQPSLLDDVLALATEDGRLPGTAGHDAARAYLLQRFADLGLQPYGGLTGYEHAVPLRWRGLTVRNLVGVLPGTDPALPPIVLGAHYDSVISAPSADDNAAGVAVVLAVAGRLARQPLRRDLLVAAFDAEEPPFFLTADMGSVRFVREALTGPLHLAIVLDLVGHAVPGAGFGLDPDLMFVTGAETHPSLPALLDGLDLPTVPVRNDRVGDMSDHHAFNVAGWPFLFFSCGEWEHYHEPSDRPEHLDLAKMARFAGDLETVLRRADDAPVDGRLDHDCTDVEVAALERHLGVELLTAVARLAGRADHRSPADLDVIVPALRFALGAG